MPRGFARKRNKIMNKNKTKILITLLILVLAAGAYLFVQYKNRNVLSLISGEVTKIEGDKVFFQTTVLTADEDQQVQVSKEDKIAVILPTTEFVKHDPLSGPDVKIDFRDIKVGDRIAVRYLKMTKDGEFIAVAIEPALSGEKYRVDNLIKNLNQ